MSVSYPLQVSTPLTIWAFDYGNKCEAITANINNASEFDAYRLANSTANYKFVSISIV